MEINILLRTIKSLNDNTTCWDLQQIIGDIKNIKLFNQNFITDYYYYYELLFLLQNEYFFTQQQFQKYIDIKNDIIEKQNPDLKLHQLMMGRGKTSVITPLISFAIKFKRNKQPTIITTSILIDQTKKYLEITSFLTKKEFNILEIYQNFNNKNNHKMIQIPIFDLKENEII